ncbi:MAG TPA: hypothetical protein VGD67_15075 [Pseudonocardiaceae bacterium]
MYRRMIGALTVVLALLGIGVAVAAPASAATDRMLSVWGSLHLEDYETWAANEHCYSSLNTNRTANPSYPIEIEWVRTCGGEIRAEMHMQAQVLSNNYLHVFGSLLFFEGTSSSTSDLDGRKNFTLYVAPGASQPLTATVWNTDEGDCDCAYYNLRVGNYAP